jgi:hypothetical protein
MEASASPRRFLGSLTRCDHFVSAHGKIGMCVHQHRPLVTAPDDYLLTRSFARAATVCRRMGRLACAYISTAHWLLRLIVHTRLPAHSLIRSRGHRLSAHEMIGTRCAAPPTHWPLHLIVRTRSPAHSLARSLARSLAHRVSAHG